MNYKKAMKKIMQQLTEYKGTVDTLANSYLAEVEKRDKELEGMIGKYTDEYIKESRMNWKPEMDYGRAISMAREKHQKIALAYIDQIKKELDSYFQIPVNPGFAATVTALKTIGAKVSDREFQLLQGASSGYWDRKLLSELATSRTEKTNKVELNETNEPERTTVDKPVPYTGVELPDIEGIYDSFRNVENAVNTALQGYCGEAYELKDIIFPLEQTNGNFKKEYKIEPPKQMHNTMAIIKMTTAIQCFDNNYHSYVSFAKMMDNLEATITEPKKKTVLTDSDRKLIDVLIDFNYPSLAQEEAIKIAKADSRLREILSLDERYGAAVKKALEGVNDNE